MSQQQHTVTLEPVSLNREEANLYHQDIKFRRDIQSKARAKSRKFGSAPVEVVFQGHLLYGCKSYPKQ